MDLKEARWKSYIAKRRIIFSWGVLNHKIGPYSDYLIKKLRNIYYGGIPASIILLSREISDGYCYNRALLLSRAFLEDDGDVSLIYANIDGIRLNPKYIKYENSDPFYAEHCFVERTTKDNKHYIIDTSTGFVYDKKLYWAIEKPKIQKINKKSDIIEFVNKNYNHTTTDLEDTKYTSSLIIPMIESTYDKSNELYSTEGIELLQREIDIYKKSIRYDEIVEEIQRDLQRLNKKKQ